MAKTYRLGKASGWSHVGEVGHLIVDVPTGETIPAASGYAVGDRLLYHPSAGQEVELACRLVGATRDWMGIHPMSIMGSIRGSTALSASSPFYASAPTPPWATHVLFDAIELDAQGVLAGTHDAANYWALSLIYNTATIWSATSFALMPAAQLHTLRLSVLVVAAVTPVGALASANKWVYTKVLSAGNITMHAQSAVVYWIVR